MIDVDYFSFSGAKFGFMRGGEFTEIIRRRDQGEACMEAEKFNQVFGLKRPEDTPAILRKRPGYQPTDLAGMLKDQLIASNRLAAAQYRVEGE